jgi:hypothetical protein
VQQESIEKVYLNHWVYKTRKEDDLRIFTKEKMNDPMHNLKSDFMKNFKINIGDGKSPVKTDLDSSMLGIKKDVSQVFDDEGKV